MSSRDQRKGKRRTAADETVRRSVIPKWDAVRRRTRYPPSGGTLYVSQRVWQETLEWMRYYGNHDSEGLVFWGGVVDGSSATVICLIAPNHPAMGGTVKLSPEESRSLVCALRDLDLKLLAQVHSHGGAWIGHSPGDDEHAASFHDGYWSIVVPNFGVGVRDLLECGVHEYHQDIGRFVRLDACEVRARLRLEPALVVLQDTPTAPRKWAQEISPWYRRIWTALKKRVSTSGSPRRSAGSSDRR